jgi:hypothetical protein
VVEGVGDFDNLSTAVSNTAEDLAADAATTATFLQAQAAVSGSDTATNTRLSLRLDMITTTLKNIKNAPALAQNVFLSHRQADALAANYGVPLSEVMSVGQQYGIAIGPESDPYSIGTDMNGDAMRMAIPVEGNGPGEYIESKISKLDALRNDYYLANPFESRQQQLYTRDIAYDSHVGNALSQFYADYESNQSRVEREQADRHTDVILHNPHTAPYAPLRQKPSDWRSSN